MTDIKQTAHTDKPTECPPEEIAMKSFFLGPQAENGPWMNEVVKEIFDLWYEWRKSLFPETSAQ